MKRLILDLDDIDYQTIMRTIAHRERVMPLPTAKGDLNGRVLAEICRGWQVEMIRVAIDVAEEKRVWRAGIIKCYNVILWASGDTQAAACAEAMRKMEDVERKRPT